VGGWYDCGKLDTLLETNDILLRKGAALSRTFPGVTIVDPVRIEEDVTLERSTIGPNVSIERGTTITDSTVAHSIIGTDCTIIGSTLSRSMLGTAVVVKHVHGAANLGDYSEMLGSG
jgi:glucose-1-phosphate thymidylyltransferase